MPLLQSSGESSDPLSSLNTTTKMHFQLTRKMEFNNITMKVRANLKFLRTRHEFWFFIRTNLRKKLRPKDLVMHTHLSGLNPSTSSRNTLLWETESTLGTIKNLRMVPLVEPRNKTVRFLWGPASVSTTMAVSWYLDKEINRVGQKSTFPIHAT